MTRNIFYFKFKNDKSKSIEDRSGFVLTLHFDN